MPLLPFQRDCGKEIDRFGGRALVALDMGLGKTILSLTWLKKRHAFPAMVICPASVKWHWQKEAESLDIKSQVLDGRSETALAKVPLTILNYDILPYHAEYIKFRSIVIDEIHYCSNHKAIRTQICQQLAQEAKHVLGLSGTPLVNRPKELWMPLQLIRPEIFPWFLKFAHRYCQPQLKPWGWTYNGATHLDELNQILTDRCMVRRTIEQVLPDLPEETSSVVPLPLSDAREYARAEADFIRWLSEQSKAKAARAKRAEKLTRIGYLVRLAAQLKLQAVVDWLNDVLETSDEKLVVFAVHKTIVQGLAKGLRYRCEVIDGSTSTKGRQEAVERFKGKSRVLVGNIKAAGTGLDGLQVASQCVFVELGWRPGDLLQAKHRLLRIGQQNHVFVHYLIARGTIEERLCEVLRDKQRVISKVLDGQDAGQDLDILGILMRSFHFRKHSDR